MGSGTKHSSLIQDIQQRLYTKIENRLAVARKSVFDITFGASCTHTHTHTHTHTGKLNAGIIKIVASMYTQLMYVKH